MFLARSYDTLVCIACVSYPSENELALLKNVLDLTGYMTDSLHCSLGVHGVLVACLAFIYLNWLYAITKFVAIMHKNLVIA